MNKPVNPYPYIERNENSNYIAPLDSNNEHDVWQEGFDAAIKWLVKWLDEPCREHCVAKPEDIPTIIGKSRWVHTQHRRDCPRCLEELLEG